MRAPVVMLALCLMCCSASGDNPDADEFSLLYEREDVDQTSHMTVRIPSETKRAVFLAAQEDGMTTSEWVAEALRISLRNRQAWLDGRGGKIRRCE